MKTITVLALLLLCGCATNRSEVIEAYQRGMLDAFELAKDAPGMCTRYGTASR